MEFKMDGNSFRADLEYGTLQASADDQYGFRPFQLLISSLAVCSGTVLQKVLAKKRIAYDDISIKVLEVQRNPDKADRVEAIHLHFVIKGKNLDDTKIQKSLAVARKNCSMVQSVIDSIEVTETHELIS
ncbi:MAG TPA: OsmC family protein [Bacillales bacterium]|nr:OsmC family protein [Bacillales bacterium]